MVARMSPVRRLVHHDFALPDAFVRDVRGCENVVDAKGLPFLEVGSEGDFWLAT